MCGSHCALAVALEVTPKYVDYTGLLVSSPSAPMYETGDHPPPDGMIFDTSASEEHEFPDLF